VRNAEPTRGNSSAYRSKQHSEESSKARDTKALSATAGKQNADLSHQLRQHRPRVQEAQRAQRETRALHHVAVLSGKEWEESEVEENTETCCARAVATGHAAPTPTAADTARPRSGKVHKNTHQMEELGVLSCKHNSAVCLTFEYMASRHTLSSIEAKAVSVGLRRCCGAL
jgi:hypothetical protein